MKTLITITAQDSGLTAQILVNKWDLTIVHDALDSEDISNIDITHSSDKALRSAIAYLERNGWAKLV